MCVGASHAFSGPAGLLSRLADLVSTGAALIGDGVWSDDPDPWCSAVFGELPRGVDGLAALAEAAGWTVVTADQSTQDEWDTFEETWVAGVRSIGTAAADAFAGQRERGYRDRYRTVLGFAWLMVTR